MLTDFHVVSNRVQGVTKSNRQCVFVWEFVYIFLVSWCGQIGWTRDLFFIRHLADIVWREGRSRSSNLNCSLLRRPALSFFVNVLLVVVHVWSVCFFLIRSSPWSACCRRLCGHLRVGRLLFLRSIGSCCSIHWWLVWSWRFPCSRTDRYRSWRCVNNPWQSRRPDPGSWSCNWAALCCWLDDDMILMLLLDVFRGAVALRYDPMLGPPAIITERDCATTYCQTCPACCFWPSLMWNNALLRNAFLRSVHAPWPGRTLTSAESSVIPFRGALIFTPSISSWLCSAAPCFKFVLLVLFSWHHVKQKRGAHHNGSARPGYDTLARARHVNLHFLWTRSVGRPRWSRCLPRWPHWSRRRTSSWTHDWHSAKCSPVLSVIFFKDVDGLICQHWPSICLIRSWSWDRLQTTGRRRSCAAHSCVHVHGDLRTSGMLRTCQAFLPLLFCTAIYIFNTSARRSRTMTFHVTRGLLTTHRSCITPARKPDGPMSVPQHDSQHPCLNASWLVMAKAVEKTATQEATGGWRRLGGAETTRQQKNAMVERWKNWWMSKPRCEKNSAFSDREKHGQTAVHGLFSDELPPTMTGVSSFSNVSLVRWKT